MLTIFLFSELPLEKREECWVFHSFLFFWVSLRKKEKCESKAVEFGLAAPDNAFTLLYGKMESGYGHIVSALESCPVLLMQVCWKQPFWKDDVIASHPGMATTCCGSCKDPEKSVKLQAAWHHVRDPWDCHFGSAGKSEHLRITGP